MRCLASLFIIRWFGLDAGMVWTFVLCCHFRLPTMDAMIRIFFDRFSSIFLQHVDFANCGIARIPFSLALLIIPGTNVKSGKYIIANIQHASENAINVECHNPYSISFVCWIRSIRTMRKLCRDLLAISVKRSPFTKYRFVCACVCIRVLRTFDYKYYGIWKSNFQFVCREFGCTMSTHTHTHARSASVIINTCWQNIDAWPIAMVNIRPMLLPFYWMKRARPQQCCVQFSISIRYFQFNTDYIILVYSNFNSTRSFVCTGKLNSDSTWQKSTFAKMLQNIQIAKCEMRMEITLMKLH